ncbi:hypothetical protein ACFPRL_07815 [Pseudoclavibacter helvolus]
MCVALVVGSLVAGDQLPQLVNANACVLERGHAAAPERELSVASAALRLTLRSHSCFALSRFAARFSLVVSR